ncbi:uncharacterized protein LOC134754603 [Cydia strobilella]|uniref:uncharacterized protein LOC134754603 n=1 Tax=Cydia strobilella TaxID=1100964 RepID=UPI003006F11F
MQNTRSEITGIKNAKHAMDKCINLDVHSAVYPFIVTVTCHVVDKITARLPQIPIDISHIALPTNCKLADEDFNKPGDVDLLLDAGIFFQILLPQMKLDNGEQATKQPIVTAGTASTPAPSFTTLSAAASSNSVACAATSQGPTLVQTPFGVIIAGRTQLPARNSNQTEGGCNGSVDGFLASTTCHCFARVPEGRPRLRWAGLSQEQPHQKINNWKGIHSSVRLFHYKGHTS